MLWMQFHKAWVGPNRASSPQNRALNKAMPMRLFPTWPFQEWFEIVVIWCDCTFSSGLSFLSRALFPNGFPSPSCAAKTQKPLGDRHRNLQKDCAFAQFSRTSFLCLPLTCRLMLLWFHFSTTVTRICPRSQVCKQECIVVQSWDT